MIYCINIASSVQQHAHQLGVAVHRGLVEGRAAGVVASLARRAPRHQESSGGVVASFAR